MDTGDIISLLVGVAGTTVAVRAHVVSKRAVTISEQAARDARQAPLKLAQRQIRADVRSRAESLLKEFGGVSQALQNGGELGPVPAAVKEASAALLPLAARLTSGDEQVLLASTSVQSAEYRWGSAAHDERMVKMAEARVASSAAHVRAVSKYGPDAADAAERDLEADRSELSAAELARSDSRQTLREPLDTAITGLKTLVRQMNAADARE